MKPYFVEVRNCVATMNIQKYIFRCSCLCFSMGVFCICKVSCDIGGSSSDHSDVNVNDRRLGATGGFLGRLANYVDLLLIFFSTGWTHYRRLSFQTFFFQFGLVWWLFDVVNLHDFVFCYSLSQDIYEAHWLLFFFIKICKCEKSK